MNLESVKVAAPAAELESDGWPARRLAWSTVAVLAVAQSVNAVDRHLINLMVGPIKSDLQISDTEIGLVLGFAFALFYTFMGLPVGRWADAHSRRALIAAGALFWSAMTIACGFATSFRQLFLARVAVGAGEATLNPSGYSLISDYFPPERRAKPMGVFIMGHTIGSGITLFAGGAFIQYLIANDIHWSLPWGTVLKPWQIAFVVAGIPGFLVALLIRSIREPQRRELIGREDAPETSDKKPSSLPVREVLAYFRTHAGVYAPMFLGFGLVLLWEMGKTLWAPTYFIRTFGMTPKQVGLLLGLMTLLFTSSGAVVGGWASERLARRGYRDAHLRAALFAAIACLPLAVVAMLLPSAAWSAALLCPVYFLGSFPFALAPAAIASITPNQMRAQLTAFYLLVINLLGFGLGPALIGALTDHLFHDEKSLRYSMALTAGLALPLAALLLYRAMGTYGRAVRELHELTA